MNRRKRLKVGKILLQNVCKAKHAFTIFNIGELQLGCMYPSCMSSKDIKMCIKALFGISCLSEWQRRPDTCKHYQKARQPDVLYFT
jgi:hypothetical protein